MSEEVKPIKVEITNKETKETSWDDAVDEITFDNEEIPEDWTDNA